MDNSYYTGATLIRGSHNRYHSHHQYPPHLSPHHQAGPPTQQHVSGVPIHPHHHHPHHPLHPHHVSFPQNPTSPNYQQKNSPTFSVLSLPPAPNTIQSQASNSLTGPPLLMQPRNSNKNNIFSGSPLIRNGPQSSTGNPGQSCGKPTSIIPISHNPTIQNRGNLGHSSSAGGLICCFQPVYYLPLHNQNPSQQQPPPSLQIQQSLSHHQHTPVTSPVRKSPPASFTTATNPPPPSVQKRRNYKSLQATSSNNSAATHKSSQNGYNNPPSTSRILGTIKDKPDLASVGGPVVKDRSTQQHLTQFYENKDMHTSLANSLEDSSSPCQSPIGSVASYQLHKVPASCNPIGSNNKLRSTSVSSSSSHGFSGSCSSSSSGDENDFQALCQDQRLQNKVSQEDRKQRKEKLLNFYFYEEHWRPQEPENLSPTLPCSSDEFDFQNLSDSFFQMAVIDPVPPSNTLSKSWLPSSNSQVTDCNNNNILSEDFLLDIHSYPFNGSREHPYLDFDSTQSSRQQSQFIDQHFARHVEHTGPPSPCSDTSLGEKVGKKKDLEVEAQIVTLANGHRDLEIRLCYVTS